MTLSEITGRVLFQTGNDAEDLDEFGGWITGYVNEGYDRLYRRLEGVSPRQMEDSDEEPKLPAWTHGALADYASWCMLRNGNSQKQNRGAAFLQAFLDVETRALRGRAEGFRGIYD